MKTVDYGKTWASITNNLPTGQTVWLVREDAKNRNLLFLGTESACFVSLNGGKSWTSLMNNLPPVAVRDLVIHPRDNDLIAATHGRAIWILDDITPLQQLTDEVLTADVYLFKNRVATQWLDRSRGGQRGAQCFAGQNPISIVTPANPIRQQITNSALVTYYLKAAQTGIQVEISDFEGTRKKSMTIEAKSGINRLRWNMRFDLTEAESARVQRPQGGRPPAGEEGEFAGGFGQGPQGTLAVPGNYLVKMTVGGKTYSTKLTIRRDPLLD